MAAEDRHARHTLDSGEQITRSTCGGPGDPRGDSLRPPTNTPVATVPTGPSAPPSRIVQFVRTAVAAPIVVYQRVVSPALPRRCRYEPTCSRYAVQAIGEYGILRGLVLAAWRLLRCNPWSRGGFDPVSAQQLFKAGPTPHAPH